MAKVASASFLILVVAAAVLLVGHYFVAGLPNLFECSDAAPLGRVEDVPVVPSNHAIERAAEDAARADLIAALRVGRCIPVVYLCDGGKAYLVCRDFAFGKAGVVPVYWHSARQEWIAATAYFLREGDLSRVLMRDGCKLSEGLP